MSFRLISIFCFLFLVIFPATDADAQFFKGIIGGWNLTSWSFSEDITPYPEFESKNGYCVGLFAGGYLSEVFGWRAEVLYTRKGVMDVQSSTNEDGQFLGEVNNFYNVDYLEIPLLANFTIPTGGRIKPALFLGPAFDFELSAKVQTEYPSGVENKNQAGWDLDNTRSTDFSLIFGGGVEIESGPHLILLQIRYVMGLKEVYYTAKNQTLSVMAGFGL